jgi:hypothetical protein
MVSFPDLPWFGCATTHHRTVPPHKGQGLTGRGTRSPCPFSLWGKRTGSGGGPGAPRDVRVPPNHASGLYRPDPGEGAPLPPPRKGGRARAAVFPWNIRTLTFFAHFGTESGCLPFNTVGGDSMKKGCLPASVPRPAPRALTAMGGPVMHHRAPSFEVLSKGCGTGGRRGNGDPRSGSRQGLKFRRAPMCPGASGPCALNAAL